MGQLEEYFCGLQGCNYVPNARNRSESVRWAKVSVRCPSPSNHNETGLPMRRLHRGCLHGSSAGFGGGCPNDTSGAMPSPSRLEGFANAPMLEMDPNDGYFEGMPELLFDARQGFQTARRK